MFAFTIIKTMSAAEGPAPTTKIFLSTIVGSVAFLYNYSLHWWSFIYLYRNIFIIYYLLYSYRKEVLGTFEARSSYKMLYDACCSLGDWLCPNFFELNIPSSL